MPFPITAPESHPFPLIVGEILVTALGISPQCSLRRFRISQSLSLEGGGFLAQPFGFRVEVRFTLHGNPKGGANAMAQENHMGVLAKSKESIKVTEIRRMESFHCENWK